MIRISDSRGEFVCFGVRVRKGENDGGDTFVVAPDLRNATHDSETGEELILQNVSKRHGYRVFLDMSETEAEAYDVSAGIPPEAFTQPCSVGGKLMAFAHWMARSDNRYEFRFLQASDPRRNGMPVLCKVTGAFVGMYVGSTWFDGPGRCVPCDLMLGGALDEPALEERLLDIQLANNAPRRVVHENETRYLKLRFEEVVGALEKGAQELEWSDGRAFEVEEVICHGFRLQQIRTEEKRSEVVSKKKYEFPCQDWWS